MLRRRWLAVILLGFVMLASPPAHAQNVSPRAAAHDGYGRMVFDWDGPVTYSADVINGELVLRFDHPVSGDFRAVVRPLSRYLRSVSVSGDHRTATFPLARAAQVKAFTNSNGSVVIDLSDAAEAPSTAVAAPAEAPATPAPTPSPAADAAAPISLLPTPAAPSAAPHAVVAAAASEASSVEVRSGEHGGYNRLVFDWSKAVDYKVEKDGGRATVTFSKPARIDVLGLQSSLPSDITVISSDTGAKSTTLVLGVPPNARLRHFAANAKVVVDIVRAADAEAPQPPAGAPPTPLAPPPGTDVAAPALKPLVAQEKPQLPSETLAAAKPPEPVRRVDMPVAPEPPKMTEVVKPVEVAKPTDQPKVAAAPVAQVATAGATPPPPPRVAGNSTAAVTAPADAAKVFSLSVSWDKPVAAAVFERAGYLWLVFDRHQEVDTKLLRRLGGEAVTFIEQLPSKDGTVLRLIVQPDYAPSVRRDGLLWVVDLMRQPAEPKAPIPIIQPATLPNGIGIALTVAEPGSSLAVRDPEVGDGLLVIPVIPLGAGVFPGRDTPDVELLQTVQGIVLVPHTEGLDVKTSRSGVSITMLVNGGLRLSDEPSAAAKATTADGAAAAPATGYFDIPAWARGGPDNFQDERRAMEANLVDVPPARKSAAHLAAARLFFANGYAPEALGFLRIAASEEPTLADTGPFRALRGACNVMMERWDLALPDLDNPLVKDDPEALMWRAAAHAGASDSPAEYSKALAAGLPLIKDYPKQLKAPLAAIIAASAIAAADDGTAQSALGILDKLSSSPLEQGRIDYLRGAYSELTGQFDKALMMYDKAEHGENREFRARAGLADVELQLKMKRLSAREAVDKLDRLRFAWRDEDFEFGLLKRLGELEVQSGDYPAALRSLRSLANNYPNNKGAGEVAKMMGDTFSKLYLDGAADSMSPVSAIGLYDEFRDLTPTGAQGDEMIRKLADRLASVDLLDRAAELLKHQVGFRLQGLDKARVGSQLALLNLLDGKPQQALDALQSSAMAGLPPELLLQRLHLQARAMADVERVPEAIALLTGDTSPEAALLRAEIYWRAQDWPNAALAFDALVEKPERGAAIDEASAKLVLSWATALTLANDERGLAALRRSFGPSMAATSYKDMFNLLTSALDRDLPDMPAVAAKIKEAEGFKTFMGAYKSRLQSNGLSGIN